jgi:RimJ/RimL family protein N-acetyltransferase
VVPDVLTQRLRLRGWTEADIEPWARLIYADSEVTRFLPGANVTPLERTERFYCYCVNHWAEHGYGIWAVTDRVTGEFIGQGGLNLVADLDAVELDYSLARAYWGQGYATELARAATGYGFDTLALPRMIALTFAENIASRRVMEKVGFQHERDVHVFGVDLLLHGNTPERFHAVTGS